METKPPQTFVLLGHDRNNAFVSLRIPHHLNGDRGFSYRSYDTIGDVFSEIKVPPNSNIVLNAHGLNGAFRWGEDDSTAVKTVKYDEFFRDQPRENIDKIFIGSCYGGSAITSDNLRCAPDGSVVLTTVAASDEGYATINYINPKITSLHPIDSYIEILENIDPYRYSEAQRAYRPSYSEEEVCDIPIPPEIGIGGIKPIIVSFEKELAELSGMEGLENDPAWNEAILLVQQHFDKKGKTSTNDFFIKEISQKIECGEPLDTYLEKRIGYALSAAYTKTTGKFDKLRESCKVSECEKMVGDKFIDDALTRLNKSVEEAGGQSDMYIRQDIISVLIEDYNINPYKLDRDKNGKISSLELSELATKVTLEDEEVFFENKVQLNAAKSYDCLNTQLACMAAELTAIRCEEDKNLCDPWESKSIFDISQILEKASGKTPHELDANSDCYLSFEELKPAMVNITDEQKVQVIRGRF